MVDKRIHLLENYGTAGTKTLCGLPVPGFYELRAAQRDGKGREIHWAHYGGHDCSECDVEIKNRMPALQV